MKDTDTLRSERVRPRLATGYVLRSGGLKPVADREVLTRDTFDGDPGVR